MKCYLKNDCHTYCVVLLKVFFIYCHTYCVVLLNVILLNVVAPSVEELLPELKQKLETSERLKRLNLNLKNQEIYFAGSKLRIMI
jgi:hypothetical protein